MRNFFTLILTLALGMSCGYFEYWMTCRLLQKRWLIWVQPVILVITTICFAAWTMGLDKLKNSPARWAGVPFGIVLGFTLAGWFVGERRRKKG